MTKGLHFRNVFLFVCGRTPQIVTETLFFFVVRRRPPVRPHEIHILTTTEGRTLILEQLLQPGTGQFARFCQEYGLDQTHILFSPRTVEVLTNRRGVALKDIRTDADNRAAADQIVAKVRALTADPHTRLFASLAGGRKTMGLYLGFALQFYGRPQDCLTHVLISPPELENNPHFFYPSAASALWSQRATVTVAEVPLILLGHKLPVLQERADLRFADLVAQSQREVNLLAMPAPVVIDPVKRRLQIGGTDVLLSGLEFALYVMVAHRKQQAACASDCRGCEACTIEAADFLKLETVHSLEAIAAEIGVRDPRLQELRWWAKEDEEGRRRFLQVCARIKRKLTDTLGEAGRRYAIVSLRMQPGRTVRYTIPLDKGLVRLPALATLPAR
ncbi:MAG: CRISPR-associated ring nuclease Csm6 [Candidatus Binatia bacterium]|nr:CRISPR-associated ring nuclease Csm6 [Candidatus Binatia bacterium]